MNIPQARRLVTEIPGPRSRARLRERERSVPSGINTAHPIVTARAFGAIVEDVDGNRLIDFASGIATLNVGHAAPEVVEAAKRQLDLETHTCFHVTANEPYLQLAGRLNRLAPGPGPKKTMFANSGVEAVENAVKIARHATGRTAVVAFDQAFHGRTLLGMSLTGKTNPYKVGFGPFAPDVHRLPFSYPYRCPTGSSPQACMATCLARALEEVSGIGEQRIAAVIVEPIQGEGGVVVPAAGFIRGIADHCRAHGIVLIADEIQTGMGRAGRWFAIEEEGVVPDLVTTAKSLGGGLPISAVTGRADLMDAVHAGGLGSTFGGNPVAAAAGLAVIEKIEREALLERSRTLGATIIERLRDMASSHEVIGDVRGRGAMYGIELVADRDTKQPLPRDAVTAIIRRCLANGLIVVKAGADDNVIRLLPPLTIEEKLLEDGLRILDESLGHSLDLQRSKPTVGAAPSPRRRVRTINGPKPTS